MKKRTKFSLAASLLFGLGLRLFKLRQLFYFSMDEALLAFRGWGLFVLKRPFLIGGGSPLQVHLPPYFYYLSAFLLVPFKFDPAGWGVWAAAISLVTISALYYLGKTLVSSRVGLLAALLYALAFTPVFFDRHFWPLNLNPLLTLLTLIFLVNLNLKSVWPYLGLAGALVLAITADPSNLPLLLTVLAFFLYSKKKLNHRFALTALAVASIVFFGPLVLFDLRHQGQNIAGLSRLIQTTVARPTSLNSIINTLLLLPRSLARFWYSPQTDISQLHTYCIPYANARQQTLPLLLVILALLVLFWFIKTHWRSPRPSLKAIVWLLTFYFAGTLFFASLGYSIFDHYLSGLLPIFAILTALLISSFPQILGYPVFILLVSLNLFQSSQAHNPYGLAYKQQLVTWANQQLAGEEFALDSISKCHRENGLRYLFELTDNPPNISFMDASFFWLYRQPPFEKMPDKILLVTDKPLETSLSIINQKVFGAMSAYILDNSEHLYQFN